MNETIPPQTTSQASEDLLAAFPRTAATHFALHAQATIFRIAHHLPRIAEPNGDTAPDQILDRYHFLSEPLQDGWSLMPPDCNWSEADIRWPEIIGRWEAKVQTHLPLRALAEAAGLDLDGRLALVTAGLVEEDSRFGTLFAELQAPLSSRRAGIECLGRIHDHSGRGPDGWALCRPLIEAGLLVTPDRGLPRAEWTLAVAPPLWDALRGEVSDRPAPGLRWLGRREAPSLDGLALPPETIASLQRLSNMAAAGAANGVVLRGPDGSERRQIARWLADAAGRHVLLVTAAELDGEARRLIGPLCTASRSMPVLVHDTAPGEAVEAPDLPGYSGPVAYVLGREGGVRGEGAGRLATLTLSVPDAERRRKIWSVAAPGSDSITLAEAARQYILPAGHVRRIGRAAAVQAGLDGRDAPTLADIRGASQVLSREKLQELADPLEPIGGWDRLVAPAATLRKLRELESRARHREMPAARLGRAFAGEARRGVRALFTGPSGTGKTLAARILAAEIGKYVFRVDLASVINKYIGETEKNLHKVLSRAEELDVVLLLDEGDALLGKRTEVRGANDRYANLETNFLLQRLEHFQGVVLVTTNAGERIDPAFERRMDVVAPFPPPEAEERLAIWRLHLPEDAAIDPERLADIAARCRMTGGQIRNAALLAALQALDDGDGLLSAANVERAVRIEYRKSGGVCPLDQGAEAQTSDAVGRRSFMSGLMQSRLR